MRPSDAEEGEAGDGKIHLGELNSEVLALDSQHPTPLTRLLKKTVAALIKAPGNLMSDPGQSSGDEQGDEHYSDDDEHDQAVGEASVEDWPGAQGEEEGRTRVAPPPDSDGGDDDGVASDVE